MKLIRHQTKQELTMVCQKKRWKGYSKYNKRQLVVFVRNKFKKEKLAVVTIQRFYRLWRVQWQYAPVINDKDPFTLEDIALLPQEDIFYIRARPYKRYAFHCQNLLTFLLKTGQYKNPFTRESFSTWDLKRLKKQHFDRFPHDQIMYMDNNHYFTRNHDLSEVQMSIFLQQQENENVQAIQEETEDRLSELINELQSPINNHETITIAMLMHALSVWDEHLDEIYSLTYTLLDINRDNTATFWARTLNEVAVWCLMSHNESTGKLAYLLLKKLLCVHHDILNVSLTSPAIREVCYRHRHDSENYFES